MLRKLTRATGNISEYKPRVVFLFKAFAFSENYMAPMLSE